MSDAPIAWFTAWQAANHPEGDPKDYLPPPRAAAHADLRPATLELDIGMQDPPPKAGVAVPPGNPHVVSERVMPMAQLAAIGMTPHAHQIASETTSGLVKGGKEQCLIDVPKWDFSWQLDDLFGEGVPYAATDTIRGTCVYDNMRSISRWWTE